MISFFRRTSPSSTTDMKTTLTGLDDQDGTDFSRVRYSSDLNLSSHVTQNLESLVSRLESDEQQSIRGNVYRSTLISTAVTSTVMAGVYLSLGLEITAATMGVTAATISALGAAAYFPKPVVNSLKLAQTIMGLFDSKEANN